MSNRKGRFTLPGEAGAEAVCAELARRLGADAIRDSDGTALSEELKQLELQLYGTYFVSRGHNEFVKEHPETVQQLLLISRRRTSSGGELRIKITEGYFAEQIKPDGSEKSIERWEVIDRTAGETADPAEWEYLPESETVVLHRPKPFHEYTVSFFARALWDPTQMYNHITNSWGDKPKDVPFDIRCDAAFEYVKSALRSYLRKNPDVCVVRFTTFFYHFMLVFNELGREKFVDWFGYSASVSVAALEAFEREYGYRLRLEDLVDGGYFNSPFRVPSPAFLDYMKFTQKFVCARAGELVRIVREEGRLAMMFLGDNWIGCEPYGDYFPEIGLDAVVGSVGDGTTLRMLSDIPHVKIKEARLLPYFFPDVFREGGDPVGEGQRCWLKARRAILRRPPDRIGYGGYPSLAAKFPQFVDLAADIAEEFRSICDKISGAEPLCRLHVAVLNCWGRLRTWQTHMVAHALPMRRTYSYAGVAEALSGLPVKIDFISFEDIKENGIPRGLDVIINAGDAGTAFSGGKYWTDPQITEKIREFVYNGGGFIGVGEPSAVQHGGSYFQLSDVLGADREMGFTLSYDKYPTPPVKEHYILEGHSEPFDFGEGMPGIRATSPDTQVFAYDGDCPLFCAHPFGGGRAVYLAGLPYTLQNARLLYRSLHWAAGMEAELGTLYADNPACEVSYYPSAELCAVVNNTAKAQKTLFRNKEGKALELEMKPGELRWLQDGAF